MSELEWWFSATIVVGCILSVVYNIFLMWRHPIPVPPETTKVQVESPRYVWPLKASADLYLYVVARDEKTALEIGRQRLSEMCEDGMDVYDTTNENDTPQTQTIIVPFDENLTVSGPPEMLDDIDLEDDED